jgi:hypothetical protein
MNKVFFEVSRAVALTIDRCLSVITNILDLRCGFVCNRWGCVFRLKDEHYIGTMRIVCYHVFIAQLLNHNLIMPENTTWGVVNHE